MSTKSRHPEHLAAQTRPRRGIARPLAIAVGLLLLSVAATAGCSDPKAETPVSTIAAITTPPPAATAKPTEPAVEAALALPSATVAASTPTQARSPATTPGPTVTPTRTSTPTATRTPTPTVMPIPTGTTPSLRGSLTTRALTGRRSICGRSTSRGPWIRCPSCWDNCTSPLMPWGWLPRLFNCRLMPLCRRWSHSAPRSTSAVLLPYPAQTTSIPLRSTGSSTMAPGSTSIRGHGRTAAH